MTSTPWPGVRREPAGSSGDGGAATSALLGGPYAIAFDSSGNLYIADRSNNRIQEVAASTATNWGQSMTADDIYTVAGSSSGTSGYFGDGGAATSALLGGPSGLSIDPHGNLIIDDTSNSEVREVPLDRRVGDRHSHDAFWLHLARLQDQRPDDDLGLHPHGVSGDTSVTLSYSTSAPKVAEARRLQRGQYHDPGRCLRRSHQRAAGPVSVLHR